jgi:hypothetical protein
MMDSTSIPQPGLSSPEYSPTEFLSPEQRWDAIAEILATTALRALKQPHEKQNLNNS